MKNPPVESYLIIGLVLVLIFGTIPFRQVVEVTKASEYTSDNNNHIEAGFGGPRVTWVKVMCNRTAEIHFMYWSGVWVSTKSILLASFRSNVATYNFGAEHATNMVEVISDGPILVRIIYTYLVETESSLLTNLLYTFGIQ
ncbi:MAG: hypothetical protein AM326_05985 [Candidatus Thorarchaeota archaeon SMTZ-45]|nr:MAG: hypothetical protein AM325_05750 [Candidatus Thorarchaeota archaeon SMTZ1-45]KXH76981.1 MAG: hypothetical protein AM326_05985 [Candidatus Thorarchaeota archaeon SMTZ-45]